MHKSNISYDVKWMHRIVCAQWTKQVGYTTKDHADSLLTKEDSNHYDRRI